MKNLIKKSLVLIFFLVSLPLFGIGRCECNRGCVGITDRLQLNDSLEGDPREVCPKICARHGGWSGEFSNSPHEPRPFC